MEPLDLLTVREVAQMLRISTFTVWRYLKIGILQGIRLGRDWRIDRREVERFLQEHRRT
jgi:excisionase family DNA binding protein